MTNERLILEIRTKNPNFAQAADRGSRKAAIRLFCLECQGGNRAEVRRCLDRECPLFCFRTGPFIEGGAPNDDTRASAEEHDEAEDEAAEAPIVSEDDGEPPL